VLAAPGQLPASPSPSRKRNKLREDSPRASACAIAATDQTRIEIVRDSVRRRAEKSAHPVSRIISVGDGPWDLETAQEAGIDFVGVTMNATPPSFCSSRPVICSGNQESLLKLLDYL
ncbi:MAG TPA: hypothetical protein PLB73_04220, partial [Leptospiraceae bacterium]|nr:hypothetical protein [Leptospiraceae bacterium]